MLCTWQPRRAVMDDHVPVRAARREGPVFLDPSRVPVNVDRSPTLQHPGASQSSGACDRSGRAARCWRRCSRSIVSLRPLELVTLSLTVYVAGGRMFQSSCSPDASTCRCCRSPSSQSVMLEAGVRARSTSTRRGGSAIGAVAAVRRRGRAGNRRVQVPDPHHVAAARCPRSTGRRRARPRGRRGSRCRSRSARRLLVIGRRRCRCGRIAPRHCASSRRRTARRRTWSGSPLAARRALVEREPGDRRRLTRGTRQAGARRREACRVRVRVQRRVTGRRL